ncbi:uncharacterized protein LOC106662958 [Cimex lectularius]|uniref:Cupin-like domain-containing protein n=1 Tax=Cimex lectularius TaxID=79782 RepID=A0A8I6RGG9_CIMLE|nr:uncharacterized protein LOC106662958 [Cimex lectularius]
MAPRSVVRECALDLKSHLIFGRLIFLHLALLKSGHRASELRKLAKSRKFEAPRRKCGLAWACLALVFSTAFYNFPVVNDIVKDALEVKCVLPNNYFIWEATRPVADCRICQNDVLFLENVTRENFAPFAYSYRPMVVRGAARDWPAAEDFDYGFFKTLFDGTPGAYDSVEEECQFLNFKTDLYSLREVFTMPQERVNNSDSAQPWYIGWSNCHAEVLNTMRKFYNKPHFLPEDAEHSHVDFIFMGYQQGAFMHLDYISRLMWQAQLRGHKTWRLNPPPECEDVCQRHSFTMNPGDILLLDTRQWYHDTYIKDGEFSLTVSSDYG